MNQPPWQQQPVYYQQPQEPAEKPKRATMQGLAIICNIAFLILIGLSVLTAHDFGTTVVALLGCSGFLLYAAGFIFLCLI